MHRFWEKRQHWILPSLLALALLLRIPLLNSSFWLDEAAQALLSIRPLGEQLEIAADFQPPFFHLVVHVLTLFSTEEWWLRLASLIPSVITVWLVYDFTKSLHKQGAAYLAALLLAVNAFFIFYSQELRPYAFTAMLATLSWWWINKIVKDPTHKGMYIGYTLTTAAGLYASYLYPFHLLGQLVYILWLPHKRLKYWFLSLGSAGLLFLPWLPYFWQQFKVGSALRGTTSGWEDVVGTPVLKAVPLTIGKFLYGMLDLSFSWPYLIATGLIVGGVGMTLFHLKKRFKQNTLMLMLTWILVPLLSSWLISWWVPIIQPKRVLFLLPGVLIFLAIILYQGISSTRKNARLLGMLTIGGYLFIQLISLFGYWTQPRLQREPWRELIAGINSEFNPQATTVVFAFDDPFAPWNWYQTQPFSVITTGTNTLHSLDDIPGDEFMRLRATHVLVLDYLRDLTDPDRVIDQRLTQAGYMEVEVLDYGQLGFVRIWERNP